MLHAHLNAAKYALKRILGALALIFFSGIGVAQATPYYAAGVQNDVAKSTVLGGGWSVCYSGSYNDSVALSSLLSNCSGKYMMLAAGDNRTSNFSILADALRTDVLYSTPGPNEGGDRTTFHLANDVEWYYSPNWSWGFAEAGASIYRNSCDYGDDLSFNAVTDPKRLCWHTGGNALQQGWRAGSTFNDIYTYYSRYVLVSDTAGDPAPQADVPVPGALVLLVSGLLGLSAVRRAAKMGGLRLAG